MFEALLGAADPRLEFATVRVVAGEMPASPGQADAWLVTGSRHGVYDGLPWIEPLKAFLRACVAARVPVVGICFGHQILAEALGGRAVKSDKGWGLGVQDYELVARPGWMDGLPERFSVRALHQDQVVELPPGATVLARSPHCAYAALAYGDPEAPDAIRCSRTPSSAPSSWTSCSRSAPAPPFPAEAAAAARASLARPVESDGLGAADRRLSCAGPRPAGRRPDLRAASRHQHREAERGERHRAEVDREQPVQAGMDLGRRQRRPADAQALGDAPAEPAEAGEGEKQPEKGEVLHACSAGPARATLRGRRAPAQGPLPAPGAAARVPPPQAGTGLWKTFWKTRRRTATA